ncbi:uncharacterized protein LOC142542265 isoform X1 [Primulina tabacum]|uniref:uncharacterized protein LOC142542265 isoform X1 n=1 Tax=Primulina tabacum TaxID=48773 RepID=UPI003F5A2B7A
MDGGSDLNLWCQLPREEVVIVDDGSADGTRRVAFYFVKRYTIDNISVVFLGRNHGKCEAIRVDSEKYVHNALGKNFQIGRAPLSLARTKVSDLEKLENQILTLAMEERKFGGSRASDSTMRISDVPIAGFGSRAHLEEKALATVDSFGCRKWYRNFLMKGFHLVVLLATGSGIRDIQSCCVEALHECSLETAEAAVTTIEASEVGEMFEKAEASEVGEMSEAEASEVGEMSEAATTAEAIEAGETSEAEQR